MSRCRSCGAPVIWAMTGKGKLMPVDPDPTPDGNLALVFGDPPTVLPARNSQLEPEAKRAVREGRLYKAHFVACPFASQHRKSAS